MVVWERFMKIIKGKNKGKEVGIHQYCNDWFSADDGEIYGVLSVQLDLGEMTDLLNHRDSTGTMFQEFHLEMISGKFKRRKFK